MASSQAVEGKVERPASGVATNLGRIAGAVGLVLLISSPLTWWLSGEFGPLVWGKLILGAALIGVYLFTNADFFARLSGSRSAGLMAMSGATIAIVLGLVGVGNFLAAQHDKEFDLTHEGLFTLSQQTTDVLGRLKTEVRVMAFYAPFDNDYQPVDETLQRYAHQTPKFTYEMIPPANRPDLVKKYQITSYGPRIVVTSGAQDARAKDPSEQELTGALIKVAEQSAKTVGFLVGHGETATEDDQHPEGYHSIAAAVEAEGYKLETVSLLKAKGPAAEKVQIDKQGAKPGDSLAVPDNIAVLVIPGPRAKLLGPEVAALEQYLTRGGRILLMLDPDTQTGLEGLAKQYKIELHDDIVVDTNVLNRLQGLGAADPMVFPADQEHPVVKDMVSPAIFSTARTMKAAAGGEPGIEARALMVTGESAWGETHLVNGTAEHDAKDNAGPANVAMVATKHVPSQTENKLSDEARLVVFGDSDWANNRYFQMQANTDLFLNTVHWCAEQEQMITIRPKARAASSLFLTGEQFGVLKFVSMDILPVLLVAAGLGIVLIRRQR